MSKVIQTKLQTLKFDRKKSQNFSKIQLRNTLTNKNSSLDIKRSGNKYSFLSSSSHSNSYSDDNDLPISADRKYKKEARTSKYHTYSEGSFKHLSEICSDQFQLVVPPSPSPQITNNVEENKAEKEKNCGNFQSIQGSKNQKREDEDEEGTISSETTEKPDDNDNQKPKKSAYASIPIITISPEDEGTVQDDNDDDTHYTNDSDDDDNYSRETSDSVLYYSSEEEDDDDDQVIQYNHLNPPQIHIAVRRDASLFKIEKISRENMTPAFNLAEVPKISNLTQKAEIDEDQNWVFSVPKQKNQVLTTTSAGMITPPESPECQYNKLGGDSTENADFDMDNGLCFIHVQKKAHRSIKSFITGTYQLNHLTVTKVNSSISPYPGLHGAIDNTTRKSKLLLKIVIVSLTEEASEEQKRFGFTFWWHKSVTSRNQELRFKLQDDAKFAIAPDSLVKESLVTWIGSQNQVQGEGIQLPCLSKADSIMRDGKKIYVVYDPSLFLV